MRRLFLGLILVGLTGGLFAQDQRIADSLKRAYNSTTYADSITFRLLRDIAFNESNPDEGIRFATMLIERAEAKPSDFWAYPGYFQQGNAHRLKGDFDKSFESYFKSLELARKLNNQQWIGNSNIAIADTYSLLDNHSNAMTYYNRGIEVLRSVKDSLALGSALINAGDEYYNNDQLDSALSYFEESGIIFDLLNYKAGQAYNLGNMGLVYGKEGRYELAEMSLKSASVLLEELGDYYPIAVYNYYLSEIYEERGEIGRAIQYSVLGYEIAHRVGLKNQVKDGAEKLATLYEQTGEMVNAYRYLKEYITYRDSINANEVIQQMADLRREYEVAQKQIEVDLLNQEKKNQQIIGVALVIIIALSVIVVIVLYRNNERKKQLNRELEMLNKTKDRFFSIISHDLRGPISAFYGISRMIRMFIKRERYEDLVKMTDEIDDSVASISTLLDNLLSWAVQQQGHFPYHPSRVNFHEMAENILHVFQPNAKAKNIDLKAEIPPDFYLNVDKNSTMTIFRNLTGNALKFTPEGGKVTLRATKKGEWAEIKVSDTGIGIPTAQQKEIFQMNEHKKSTYGTSGEKGLGLGLQLVNEFTQLNKGSIQLNSIEDEGTTFTILLPIDLNQPEGAPPTPAHLSPSN